MRGASDEQKKKVRKNSVGKLKGDRGKSVKRRGKIESSRKMPMSVVEMTGKKLQKETKDPKKNGTT